MENIKDKKTELSNETGLTVSSMITLAIPFNYCV